MQIYKENKGFPDKEAFKLMPENWIKIVLPICLL